VCGRFALFEPLEELVSAFRADPSPELRAAYRPSWNVSPGRNVVAVTVAVTEAQEAGATAQEAGATAQETVATAQEAGATAKEGVIPRRSLGLYQWGLVPGWAEKPDFGARTFNARAESVAHKPTFRSAFRRRRCLVPVDGFYEWRRDTKQPYYFSRWDGSVLALAGLWETWRGEDARGRDLTLDTVTVITTDANLDVAPVHPRMPVVLEPSEWDIWLDPSLDDKERLLRVLDPAPAGTLRRYPVSRLVNRASEDGERLLEELVVE